MTDMQEKLMADVRKMGRKARRELTKAEDAVKRHDVQEAYKHMDEIVTTLKYKARDNRATAHQVLSDAALISYVDGECDRVLRYIDAVYALDECIGEIDDEYLAWQIEGIENTYA